MPRSADVAIHSVVYEDPAALFHFALDREEVTLCGRPAGHINADDYRYRFVAGREPFPGESCRVCVRRALTIVGN